MPGNGSSTPAVEDDVNNCKATFWAPIDGASDSQQPGVREPPVRKRRVESPGTTSTTESRRRNKEAYIPSELFTVFQSLRAETRVSQISISERLTEFEGRLPAFHRRNSEQERNGDIRLDAVITEMDSQREWD